MKRQRSPWLRRRSRIGLLGLIATLAIALSFTHIAGAQGNGNGPHPKPGRPPRTTTTTSTTTSTTTTTTTTVPTPPPLAIDASTPAEATGATVTLTTPMFSPPANSKLVAFVAYDAVLGTSNNQKLSGGGLPWQLVRRVNPSSSGTGASGGVEIWFADVSAAPGDIRAMTTQSQTMQATLKVVVFRGAAAGVPASAGASSSGGSPSISINAAAGASVWAVASDWAAKGGTPIYNTGTVGYVDRLAITPESAYRAYVMRRSALMTSTGMSTLSMAVPTGQISNIAAVEIRDASTTAPTTGTTTTVAPTTTLAPTTATTSTVAPITTTTSTVASTSTTTVAPTTTTTTTSPSSFPPLEAWEGGPAYWSKFSKAASVGWTDPSFFPIGVWLENPESSAFFRSIGINTMVGVFKIGANLDSIGRSTGMYFLVQADEFSASEIGSTPYVVGHLASDEIDMNSSNPVPEQQSIVNDVRARNDGRFVYSNYGKGLMGLWWNPESLPALTQMVDVASGDLYFWTDPNLTDEVPQASAWPAGAPVRDSAGYGWTVDRMESFLSQTALHPTWNFVEVGHPFSESFAPTITPDQMEGAVWQSIVHGARGIVFFNHSFGGSCITQHVLQDCGAAMRDRVSGVTARIRSLAPILNSQSYTWNGGSGVTTMLKRVSGSWYLVSSLAQQSAAGSKTLNVPVMSGTATVVGENRTVPIVNGHIVDAFASNNVMHVYQMT